MGLYTTVISGQTVSVKVKHWQQEYVDTYYGESEVLRLIQWDVHIKI